MLGGGSNVLIADAGIRGLVIRPTRRRGDADRRSTWFAPMRPSRSTAWCGGRSIAATPASRPGPARRARSAARSTATRTGRRSTSATWSRACACVKPDGTLLQAPADRMEFDYDYSRLKHTGEIVLWAAFRVHARRRSGGAAAVARESLAFRKRTQPLESPSAGCIFMNPDPVARQGARRHSAVGRRAGRSRRPQGRVARRRARVADARQLHHQRRLAPARPISHALVERCRAAVKEQFGVTLRNEIICLGSDFRSLSTGRYHVHTRH